MNNVTKRTLSGIAFIVIVTGALRLGPLTFFLLFSVINCLCLFEFYKLAAQIGAEIQITTGIITGFAIFLLNFLIAAGFLQTQWLFVIVPFILMIFITELYRKKQNPLQNIVYTLAGLIYPTLSFVVLTLVVYYSRVDSEYNYQTGISLFVLIWSFDTLAYVVGKRFGRHKLMAHISPAKSWEGVTGGLIFTLLVALVLSFITQAQNLLYWIVLAFVVSVAGLFGDLAESALKRSASVKESGNLIPGHGGMLDRFDSALFVFPMAYVFFLIIAGID